MDDRLKHYLRPVAARLRSLHFWNMFAAAWFLAASVGIVLLWFKLTGTTATMWDWQAVVVLAVGLLMGAGLLALGTYRNLTAVALAIEQAYPNLQQRLLTAVEQRPSGDGYSFLQDSVLNETLQHARRNYWPHLVRERQLDQARWRNVPPMLLFAVVTCALALTKGPQTEASQIKNDNSATGSESFALEIAPGDADLERGTGLTVTARFTGPVPATAELVLQGKEQELRLPMRQSLSDPMFGGYMPEVQDDLAYHVETPLGNSDVYRVRVFEFPELIRSDAKIEYPAYTGFEGKLVEDTRRVTSVEGAELTWICYLNKDVELALLEDESGEVVPLELSDGAAHAFVAKMRLSESKRWKLHLIDSAERRNKVPPTLSVRVQPNEPPKLELATARDVRVSPLEELPIVASVQDDFGVERFGISYTLAGQETHEVVLAESLGRLEKQEVEHIVAFEELEAEPDQLLSYHLWAEDFGPDGKLRKTMGDMFFAEVRPFEEIFRQGQQPQGEQSPAEQQPGQQGGSPAQQAGELAELQKQIINGTWRVLRDTQSTGPSENYFDDVGLLQESQESAIEQASAMKEQLQDPQSLDHIEAATRCMGEAAESLSSARASEELSELRTALAAEQEAYQALLRLRAREHEVVRSQQQQQGGQQGGGGTRQQFQQQLDELELEDNEDRYETERQAQANEPATQQEREMRQILNRLRDLARRQEDINERLKQLQSALQEAETEEEQEEIRRQLKRLREQQEEILRDTDEVSERMDQQDSEELQETREQLEQTRENVRQSAEALSDNEAGQALAQGTRAERQFEELRDEVRRQSANAFSESMRQMRQSAQELDERQQDLLEQLADLEQEQAGSLRPEGRDNIEKGLADQADRLQEVLDSIQDTVLEAETSERLLAENLYDTFREVKQSRTTNKLSAASELIGDGFDPQGRQVAESAGEDLRNLREGVERAAESVLGDEVEGLRQALGELDELTQRLNNEIDEAQRTEGSAAGENRTPGDTEQQASPPSPEESTETPGRASQGDQATRENERAQENGESPSQQSSASGESGNTSPQQSENSEEQQDRQRGSAESNSSSGEGQQSGAASGGEPSESDSASQESPSSQQSPTEGQGGQEGNSSSPGENPSSETSQQEDGSSDGRQTTQGSATQGNREGSRNPDDQQRREGPRGINQFTETTGGAPLTGDDFREWSDRLRDVEEMVEDPELRAEAARIRDRARVFRRDFLRHSREPNWALVDELVAQPLEELRREVSAELLRRSAEKNALVPIDRDPVPSKYAEQVRRYYEELGSGE